jgi:hypothetical protein
MDFGMSKALLNLGGLGFATFDNIEAGARIDFLSNYHGNYGLSSVSFFLNNHWKRKRRP